MATPLTRIALILSPRKVRTASPRFTRVTEEYRKTPSKKHVRRLQFLSPNLQEDDSKVHKRLKDLPEVRFENRTVQLEKLARNLLDVNTPQRAKVVNHGLENKSVLHILGTGTFGTVIEGTYKGRSVAVKVIKSSRGHKEANALNLNHRNVVKVIHVTCDLAQLYGIVIMEYHNKSLSLQTLLDDETCEFDMERIKLTATDICAGLQYCHDNEILHLDIKPSNVLVCSGWVCKLCDFGNSLRSGDECSTNCVGTPMYTAPEILEGKRPCTKSDIYSLGVLFWQLKERKMPYSEIGNNEIIIYKVVKFGIRPSIIGCLQDDYFSLYTSCWQTNPADRPDARSVLEKLFAM